MHSTKQWVAVARKIAVAWPLAAVALALVAMACSAPTATAPAPTPDYHALETRVEAMLHATYTAMAPPPTETPVAAEGLTEAQPTPTPTVTPTRLPEIHRLAYVQVPVDGEPSIVLERERPEDLLELEHLTGPERVTDLSWSADGEQLVFVSTYGAILSRGNERNVFIVRSDGTGLRMVTGDYVPPDQAPGPFVSLEGRVVGAVGACVVSAQGVSGPVEVDETGSFELVGVPVGATWARVVCTSDGHTLRGDVDLVVTDGVFAPVLIQVVDSGQGWKQADLSRDGNILAGTYYRWALDDEGKPQYRFEGRIVGLASGFQGQLEDAPEGSLDGVAWSPVEDVLVGAVTGSDGAWLWLWDVTGASVRELLAMPNPDDQILTLANPAWSPDGSQVAFEVRRWAWWGEGTRRTDLMVVSADGANLRTLVELDWGEHAVEPGWMPDGQTVTYQYSRTAPDQEVTAADNGSIWMVDVQTGLRLPWTSGPYDYCPAPRPVGGADRPSTE
ncbi:MAG: hypothetical protein ACOX3S_11520 [Anaerolineae bacterium]|jgi:Tol biopolymer transport system component